MKIGIDLRAINETSIYRGIGKYVVSLTRALAEIDAENHYYLFLFNYQAEFAQKYLPHNPRWHFVFLEPSKVRRKKFIRTVALGNDPLRVDHYGLDVVFQQDKNYPIKTAHTPVVSIIHDLIPQIFPDLYLPPVRVRQNNYVGLVVYLKELRKRSLENTAAAKAHRTSRKVIAISSHTAKDAERLGNLDPEQLVVIPHGTETIQSYMKPVRPKGLSQKRRYILYVGGVDPRKQLNYLVNQFATLAQEYPDLDLVIAGKEAADRNIPLARKLQNLIQRLSLAKRVILTGYINDSELAYLYQHAVAFVFPSKYEGFGLPILESFMAGCPVIAYINSSIPEVAGDAALLIHDGVPLVPAVKQLLNDAALRNELIAKGKKRASEFTWQRTARKTLAVLEAASRHV